PGRTFSATRSGSSWTVDLPSPTLADGSYTGRAEQVVNGSTQVSSANLFRVDTTAPSGPTITAPASRTNDNPPMLSGSAAAATGDSTTVTVRIYAGSTATGTPVQTFNGTRSGTSWSGTATTLGDGTYTATATQTDDVGHST